MSRRTWIASLAPLRAAVLPFALGGALPAVLAPVLAAQDAPPEAPAPYVAHEWGTFTSMVGETGVVLEGLHREEEALPEFVHDLLRVEETSVTDGKVPASRVTQKMETPVVYFHCEQPLRVQARVFFAQGLMTQFYPLPTEVWPRVPDARGQRLDMSKVQGSWLAWDVDLLPRTGAPPAGIPAVAAEHPWAIARQVDCAWVRTVPPDERTRAEAEHYLFYRGLGRWQPAVTLVAHGGGAATLQNATGAAIPFAAVLELGEHGGRFAANDEPLGDGSSRRVELGGVAWERDREMLARRLGAAVLRALVQSGLHLDEARAMVATWSRSWFQKDGARVIWLVPRRLTDDVLPLSLSPPPRELVRTLVGRLEFVTPERRAAVEDMLRRDATAELASLDRFLEPHLRNVAALGSDAAVRELAARRLRALADDS